MQHQKLLFMVEVTNHPLRNHRAANCTGYAPASLRAGS